MFRKLKPILIIQHAPTEQPALLDRALESQGIPRILIHPYQGDAYPSSSEIRGVISLGGPMSAYEDTEHPWILNELSFLKTVYENDMPILGICLGGQLLARALGGRVERAPQPEIGWWPVEINSDGNADPLLGIVTELLGHQPIVYQWHQDTFHLPPGATLLAGTKACSRQAFRLGKKAYGLQFHPEVDSQILTQWLDEPDAKNEIGKVEKANPRSPIQDISTQKHHASQAEEGSAIITAILCTLFGKQDSGTSKRLADRNISNSNVTFEFEGANGIRRITGQITRQMKTPIGEFILLKAENGDLWPLRSPFYRVK